MGWGEIGAVAAALVAAFIAGHAWFYIVEGALGGLKRRFGKKGRSAWHTLPPEHRQKEDEDRREPAPALTSLQMDGGDEVNCPPVPCRDGEDALFAINAVDEAALR